MRQLLFFKTNGASVLNVRRRLIELLRLFAQALSLLGLHFFVSVIVLFFVFAVFFKVGMGVGLIFSPDNIWGGGAGLDLKLRRNRTRTI